MQRRFAIIGAGPSGLAAARAFQKKNIDFVGFESSDNVGGLWNIDNPRSTMYESAHLISSRTTTEFSEYPMKSLTDYPSHRELRRYFEGFADHFALREHFRFNTPVETVVRDGESWLVNGETFDGVVLANGTLAKPTVPSFPGEFTGELRHSSTYSSAREFDGKRVLIVGAGNSGCDIAVDAVHHAASVDLSVRRGYYFVPRYLFGKPADTLNQGRPLPARIKQFVDSRVLKAFTGDPVHFGFPKPDYKIYESHPIVNTMILNHLGQGDLAVRTAIDRFDGRTVHFVDGSHSDYDLILLATGYTLDYPFVDRAELNWSGMAPRLYLNMFPPDFSGIFVLGMIEASGIGWQGRAEQADLIASYLSAPEPVAAAFRARAAKPWPDVSGGYTFLALERMSYYVNKDAYRRTVKAAIARLEKQ
ncbi:MAG: flavin-containing monooxygenase [Microbacteriaceae bacterium]